MESNTKISDDLYLGIWEISQSHSRTRWAIATFYFGISFSITGFTFNQELSMISTVAMRGTAIFVYWFGVFVFNRFYKYTKALRNYLLKLEKEERTTVQLHSFTDAFMLKGFDIKASTLLIVFGILYTAILIEPLFRKLM